MTLPITVVIPHFRGKGRAATLGRCLESIGDQTLLPEQVIVQVDRGREGAAVTRTRGLRRVDTPWVAFLDDDDIMSAEHLETLWNGVSMGHEYVFSYFAVIDRFEGVIPDDPLGLFGHVFDVKKPTQTTSTILVNTALAMEVGGFHRQPSNRMIEGTRLRHGEDFQFTLDCIAAGCEPVHLPHRTWFWRIWGHNTSGNGA